MEGWLTKRGHIFKTWKRRWFVLDESQGFVLNYYQKEDKQTLKGTYAITGMSSVSPVSDEGSHRNAILLHAAGSGGRELLMSADSPEVALQWTAALRAMIAQCRDADDTQSPLGRSPAGESNAATSTLPKHGLSLAGFRNFVTVCGGETELFNLTTAEVAETFVKRLTKAGEWSYCSKLAAERSAHVGVATHFIR